MTLRRQSLMVVFLASPDSHCHVDVDLNVDPMLFLSYVQSHW